MTKILLIFPLVIMCFSAYGQQKITIENLLNQEKLSGAVYTIVKEDSIKIFSAGYKNLQTKEILQSNNQVHIGSITKPILALGVLMLDTKGKLNIDDPVKKYLPDLPIENPWESTHPIKIRHLLDHTSGLTDFKLWHFFSSSSNPRTPLSAFYTRNTDVLRVQEKPGTIFSYSNIGYTLLGILMEKVVNQPYEQFLDENLLKPIGMNNSTFQFVSQLGNSKNEKLAMGHFDDGPLAPALPIYPRPAAQFTTTAFDMGILIQFYLNKGKVNNLQVIDGAYFEQLGLAKYTEASKRSLNVGYGLGISKRDRHGVVGLAHSGNVIGYRAMMYIFPKEKKGFFIAHNMDSESADYERFNQILIENLNIKKTTPKHQQAVTTKQFADWAGYYIPKITKIEPWQLLDIIGNFTKVSFTEKSMKISPFQKKVLVLNHIGGGVFQQSDKVNPSHLLYEITNTKYLTTSFFTMKKINGWKIFLSATSLFLGIFGLLIIFTSSIYNIFINKSKCLNNPIFVTFLGILLFLISILLISTKNIIFIGDKNAGSTLLYLSTILLPILVVINLAIYLKNHRFPYKTIDFWATLCVFQLVVLLILFGLIPFATWR